MEVLRPLRALLVEDSEDDCALLARALHQGGYDLIYKRVDSAETLRLALDGQTWDVVISDYSMPGFNGSAALTIVREKDPDVPFVFLSGTIGEEVAVQAMRMGAQDYVLKNSLARLLPAVRRELGEAELRRQHKESEQRLRQMEKFEALGKLAGGIAHDFNNVIGIIMGWAEIGREEVPAGGRADKLFTQIRDQAMRAAGITRQLLTYARRQILEPRNLDLNAAINECTPLLQRGIGEQIELKTALAPDLHMVRADPGQVEQILLNLCFNARDAMPNGGQLLITTRNAQMTERHQGVQKRFPPGRCVELSVRDTGVGMRAEILENIFEPFFTTKEVGKGTGLGLSTVMGIVKQHQGHIEVDSEVGKGTVFRVYLPMSDGIPVKHESAEEMPLRRGTETILVAEDDEALREVLRQMLGRLGYSIVLAQDGQEAVSLFQEQPQNISLAILDVIMPKMGGPDVCAKLRTIRPDLPVIFASGYSEHSPALNAMAMTGIVNVIQKPFSIRHLANKVREELDHTRVESL